MKSPDLMFNSKSWVEGGVPGPKIKPSTQIALTSKVRGPLPPAKLIEEHPKPSMDRMTIFLIVFCRQMPVFFCTLPLLTIVTRVLCGCPDPIVGILLSGFFFKKAGGGAVIPKHIQAPLGRCKANLKGFNQHGF